jgi:group I intron endonuclease
MLYNIYDESQFYIGGTKDLYKRITRHISYLNHKKHPNTKLQEMFNQTGIEEMQVRILQQFDTYDYDKVKDAEQHFIDLYEPKINILKDSRGWKGAKHSEETKQKISNWNKGKVIKEETKQKFREMFAGKMFAPEACENFVKNYVQKIKRKVNVYTMEGEFIATWSCIVYCGRDIDGKHAHIGRVLAGGRKSTRNLTFKYNDEAPNETSIVESYDFSKMLGIISDKYGVNLNESKQYSYQELKDICTIDDDIDEVAKFNFFLYKNKK